jgi:DNA-binding LytR/AlgR family response regulator
MGNSLLLDEEKKTLENTGDDCIFVKSDRRYFRVNMKDILFVEGLKDYVIIQLDEQRIITRMSLKSVQELLPADRFLRINRSYIVNRERIDSFDNNDVFIKLHEIAIGNVYRDSFFEKLMGKR